MAEVPGTNHWFTHFTSRIEEAELEEWWALNFNYNLRNELDAQRRAKGWKIYVTSTFAKFICRRCSNSWSSYRASMVFHYRLRRKSGIVLLRLFQQQCRECKNPIMHKPQVNSDQMYEVLDRLILKILKNCYRVPNLVEEGRAVNHRKTKPHESNLCEACGLGMCNQS
ncbi:receptor-transporting protein 3-like [Amblyraja radiata]|uniref:receptor-transporting protein 3-like n=1 Tax=Amblyraja radiata TaxID=386614 RepID=UPI00140392F5|nr:receptor-transporting protein 3-like [Amblyraja radiata]